MWKTLHFTDRENNFGKMFRACKAHQIATAWEVRFGWTLFSLWTSSVFCFYSNNIWKKSGFGERLIFESIEIQLDPLTINRDSGLQHSSCWKPVICLIEHSCFANQSKFFSRRSIQERSLLLDASLLEVFFFFTVGCLCVLSLWDRQQIWGPSSLVLNKLETTHLMMTLERVVEHIPTSRFSLY